MFIAEHKKKAEKTNKVKKSRKDEYKRAENKAEKTNKVRHGAETKPRIQGGLSPQSRASVIIIDLRIQNKIKEGSLTITPT